jgi:[ribosomal protein S5]-alanine N-acetyltransferase
MSLTRHKYEYKDGLQSLRLITRCLTPKDKGIWARFFNDALVGEFFPNPEKKTDSERADEWIDKQIKRYAEERYGLQALIEKETGNFVGQCGMLLQEVDGLHELEVGYHIFPEFRGMGYAAEAARLFLNYAFQNKQSGSVISIIHKNNLRSQRVAEKNGLKRGKETGWNTIPVYIYRISEAEFRAASHC